MRYAVLGSGLIGSAAARHLATLGHDVTLIGPGEPADWGAHGGVFASHYDEGRITRGIEFTPFWAEVSRASPVTTACSSPRSVAYIEGWTDGAR